MEENIWEEHPTNASQLASEMIDVVHFTGKERDAESGLDYFGARYYAENDARWLTPDSGASPILGVPLPYAYLRNPQSFNLYGYVDNNPLIYIDPDGHACQSWSYSMSFSGQVVQTESGSDDSSCPDWSDLFDFFQESQSFNQAPRYSLQSWTQPPLTSAQNTPPRNSPSTESFWQKNWNCVKNVGLPALENDLNPFSLGIGTAADATSQLSQASLAGAAAYSVERGLTVPLRSGVVRAGVSNAEALGRASAMLSLIDLDVALADGIRAEHAGCKF